MIENILANLERTNCAMDATFIQAVSEVLRSLEPILQNDTTYQTYAILERLITLTVRFVLRFNGWMITIKYISIMDTVSSLTMHLAPTKEGCVFIAV